MPNDEAKRRPGRPGKADEDKAKPKNFHLNKENNTRISAIATHQRSKVVNEALDMYFAVQDGKKKLVDVKSK